MSTLHRILLAASSLALVVAAGCGGSSTKPSSAGSAAIGGTVSMGASAARSGGSRSAVTSSGGFRTAAATSGAAGVTVSIAGTNLSAVVDESGYFHIPGVPPGHVQLVFTSSQGKASAELSDVGPEELVEIEVEVSGNTAAIVSEARTDHKIALCHVSDDGRYRRIEVGRPAEAAHRAHGDGAPLEPVPGSETQTFDENCGIAGPSVDIQKHTNGQDADRAPGPTLAPGDPVSWDYIVRNTGTIDLTNIEVTDDQGVVVTCPGTTLAPGESMTCTGSGVAIEGQYANVGTVTAESAAGPVTDSDRSHYFGGDPDEEEGPMVSLCHKTGNGRYIPIEVSVNAEPAHRAHGDGMVGEAVPGSPGSVFGQGCTVVAQ